MKPIIFLLICLLVLPVVFSADANITFSRLNYSSGESAWAQINFNGVDLTKDLVGEDFIFTQNETAIYITKVVIKVSSHVYFFYFEVPKINDGDYKVKLKDVEYIKNNVMNRASFITDFKVENKNQTIYVWPSVFFTEYMDKEKPIFKGIMIKNIGWEKRRFIVTASDENLVTSIAPFDFNLVGQSLGWIVIRTNITDYTPGFKSTMIKIETEDGSYEYPLIMKKKRYADDFGWPATSLISNVEQVNVTSNKTEVNITNTTKSVYVYPENSFRLIDPTYKVVDQSLKRSGGKVGVDWTLKNFAEKPLHNIYYELSGNLNKIVNVTFNSNNTILNPGEEFNLNVAVYPNLSIEDKYEGRLTLYSDENRSDSVDFYIKIVNESAKIDSTTNKTFIPVVNTTRQNITPVDEPKGNSTALMIVIVVIVMIAIVALIFYRKSRPKKEKLDEYLKAIGQ